MGPVARLAQIEDRAPRDDLAAMIRRVFEPRTEDTALAVLVDLPDDALPDNEDWALRRSLAADWGSRVLAP